MIGNVHIGDHVSFWSCVMIRGDMNIPITIEANSNIQNNSVLHADDGVPLVIGDDSLIGIGVIVLNRARTGKQCLVGASALVIEGKEFADSAMILGSPTNAVHELSVEEKSGLQRSAMHYVANGERHRRGLKRVG